MEHSWLVYVLAFLVSFHFADSSPLVLHEKRRISGGLERGKRIDGTASIAEFKVGLKQSNLENIYDHLLNISHPDSPHYGKLWSPEEVRQRFGPPKETVQIVRGWLEDSGFETTESNGWLSFTSSIKRVEDVFNTEYFEFNDYEHEGIRIGCEQYHLPEHISSHVDFLTPAVTLSARQNKLNVKRSEAPSWSWSPHTFGPWPLPPSWPPSEPPPAASHLPEALRNCSNEMTPTCIRALYDVPDPEELASGSRSGSAGDSLGVFAVGGSYNQSDLDKFFKKFAPEIPAGTHPIGESINGAPTQQGPHGPRTNGEEALDIMVMYGLVYPETITLYQVAKHVEGSNAEKFHTFQLANEELLDALDASFCDESNGLDCGTRAATRVISNSYGASEVLGPSKAYLERLCNEFAKLGLQGTTFTYVSGDWGVSAQPGLIGKGKSTQYTNGCIVAGNYNASTEGTRGPIENGTVFSSQFPQSCPYVLSVGGTMLWPNDTVNDPESSMRADQFNFGGSTFGSSGGFSNYFSRPSYQNAAVEHYFSNYDPGYKYYEFNGIDFSQPGSNIGANNGVYNRIGRGFPDVSANGYGFPIISKGEVQLNYGTSVAAPIWASIITLINEKRSQIGKGPVGFINPTLYARHREVFHDITNGTNPGCFTEGFSAVNNWDPVTGLGTPNFPKLLELFLSLP